ncbi:MAG: hypothetical protein PHI67_10000 [Candidatus Methanomethylophilaceae archaeon]|nr:hypothetical protein [Candidatus Methanomethylophilaceae archaeon]
MFRPAIGSTVRDANDIPFTVVRAGMPVDCDHAWIWLGASYTLKTKQRGVCQLPPVETGGLQTATQDKTVD